MNFKLSPPTRLILGTLLMAGFIAPPRAVPQTAGVIHLLCTGDAMAGGQDRVDINLQSNPRSFDGRAEGTVLGCTTTINVSDEAYSVNQSCTSGGFWWMTIDRVTGGLTFGDQRGQSPKTAVCKPISSTPAF